MQRVKVDGGASSSSASPARDPLRGASRQQPLEMQMSLDALGPSGLSNSAPASPSRRPPQATGFTSSPLTPPPQHWSQPPEPSKPPPPDGGSASGMPGSPGSSGEWRTKQIVFIRHARSAWNEFLGAHKKAAWEEQEKKRAGFRQTLRQMVGGKPVPPRGVMLGNGTQSVADFLESPTEAQGPNSGFWQGVRGGVKHVANALGHAGTLNQVDHPLSFGGLTEARALRAKVAGACAAPPEGSTAALTSLLQCRHWYISPFARAMQTAAYALAPLFRRDPAVKMMLTPMACEIVNSSMAYDCQGKKGNIGFRMVTRAINKLTETMEDDQDDPKNRGLSACRQAELNDVTATLCAMDLSEVEQVWWTDVGAFKKEHLRLEDLRVRRLVARLLLQHDVPCVGVVGHSLLFKRIIQIYVPGDPALQEMLRTSLRNGVVSETDPINDKIINCGTLVTTWRYRAGTGLDGLAAEIVKAEFLFDGRMESAAHAANLEDVLETPESVSPQTLRRSSSADLL